MIPSDPRRFAAALLMILLAALALRVGYVLTVTRNDHHIYDAFYYDAEATTLADGHGFVNPFAGLAGQKAGPAADHPPLTSIVLMPAAKLDQAATWLARGSLAMRFEMTLLGVGVVAAIGLLGRRLAGDGVGLLAAAIVAIYPNLWMNDGLVMSETLATLLTVISLLLVYRIVRRPSAASVVALGVVCGLATLTRAELVLYVPLLAVPAVWMQRSSRRGDSRRSAWLYSPPSSSSDRGWSITSRASRIPSSSQRTTASRSLDRTAIPPITGRASG